MSRFLLLDIKICQEWLRMLWCTTQLPNLMPNLLSRSLGISTQHNHYKLRKRFRNCWMPSLYAQLTTLNGSLTWCLSVNLKDESKYVSILGISMLLTLKMNFPFLTQTPYWITLHAMRCCLLWMVFFCYNQIWVTPQDQHKTTFKTPWGTLCYKVMPFGLKNIGDTYQHVMMYVFHNMMHDVVKDYVDDLLSKLKTREQHQDVLEKVFACLLQHNIRLNPRKCVFGVTFGKLLGFIIFK